MRIITVHFGGWLTQQMFSSLWEGLESWSCQVLNLTFTIDIHMTLSPSQKHLFHACPFGLQSCSAGHTWRSEWTQVVSGKPAYDFWCLHKPLILCICNFSMVPSLLLIFYPAHSFCTPPHILDSSSEWTYSASHLLESSFSFRTWKSLNLEYQFKVMG